MSGVVEAPAEKVWGLVSKTKRLPEWVTMVERCTELEGKEGIPGYTRLVSGFMFPQEDGERSWIKERLVSMDMDSSLRSYAYRMDATNIVGLDGSVNTLKVVNYGQGSTLVEWSFEVNPLKGLCEDTILDFLGFLYKSCINRLHGAIEAAASNKV